MAADSASKDKKREWPADDERGDAACWAHLVCPECGRVLSDGHRRGCSQAPEK